MIEKFALAVALALVLFAARPTAAESTCPADGKMQFLCGMVGAEDILQLGDSKWLIASGLGTRGAGGGLHLIDGDAKTWEILYPGAMPAADMDMETYGKCPGVPDPASFVAHGISLRQDDPTHYTLYAINHAREAVEVFALDAGGQKPALTWIGCVIMPDGTYTNGVAALPQGGFVATKMYDPSRPDPFAEIRAGKVTGLVYEWTPQGGFSVVPGSAMSGPNGIVTSPDGQHIYLAAMGARELVSLSLDGAVPERKSIKIDFGADNLRWTRDGKLLVAGSNPPSAGQCAGAPCPRGWTVLAWNPADMTVKTVLNSSGASPLSGVSVALQALGFYWVGSFSDSKLGYVPVN